MLHVFHKRRTTTPEVIAIVTPNTEGTVGAPSSTARAWNSRCVTGDAYTFVRAVTLLAGSRHSSEEPSFSWRGRRRLGGPQGRSGRVRKNLAPPGFDPVASRYTDWATWAGCSTTLKSATISLVRTIKFAVSCRAIQAQPHTIQKCT
jgi:hypothetical protein